MGKTGPKRARTLEPRSLTQQLQVAKSQTVVRSEHTQVPIQRTVGFIENEEEKRERELLKSKVLVYMFIKQTIAIDLSGSVVTNLLHEFKDLYAYSTQGTVNKSNIY